MADWRDALAGRLRGELLRDEPLGPRTTVKVGGPADLLVRPADAEDLVTLLGQVRALGVPLTVLGGAQHAGGRRRGARGGLAAAARPREERPRGPDPLAGAPFRAADGPATPSPHRRRVPGRGAGHAGEPW
jgi:UDP-N-acetylmuramate dehydrogenase